KVTTLFGFEENIMNNVSMSKICLSVLYVDVFCMRLMIKALRSIEKDLEAFRKPYVRLVCIQLDITFVVGVLGRYRSTLSVDH
ncbi:hypothetical protein CR513_48629, partial [Mucuna pruriens]